jgi:hypothetical protein
MSTSSKNQTNEEKIDAVSRFLAFNNRETVNTRFGLFCEENINGIGNTTPSLPIQDCLNKLNNVYDQFLKPLLKMR